MERSRATQRGSDRLAMLAQEGNPPPSEGGPAGGYSSRDGQGEPSLPGKSRIFSSGRDEPSFRLFTDAEQAGPSWQSLEAQSEGHRGERVQPGPGLGGDSSGEESPLRGRRDAPLSSLGCKPTTRWGGPARTRDHHDERHESWPEAEGGSLLEMR